jgi:hypothetical protein
MSDTDFEAWLVEMLHRTCDGCIPSEENLIALFSVAMREDDPKQKAQSLVDVANLCMALAGQNLGVSPHVANRASHKWH